MMLSFISSKSKPGWNQNPASSLVVTARDTYRGRSEMGTKFGFCGPTEISAAVPDGIDRPVDEGAAEEERRRLAGGPEPGEVELHVQEPLLGIAHRSGDPYPRVEEPGDARRLVPQAELRR